MQPSAVGVSFSTDEWETQTPSTSLRHPYFGAMCRKAVLGVCGKLCYVGYPVGTWQFLRQRRLFVVPVVQAKPVSAFRSLVQPSSGSGTGQREETGETAKIGAFTGLCSSREIFLFLSSKYNVQNL